MLAQTGVILAAVIGAETEPRRRRTGWGGTGEPTNETTREDRAGTAGRKTDDSGADAGAQPPRPPAPATPQPPTVDRDATDARQAVHRQGSPRSGPDRHALHPAGRAPAGFFGFVKPAGPAAGGRDVFVLGSAVKHVAPPRWQEDRR